MLAECSGKRHFSFESLTLKKYKIEGPECVCVHACACMHVRACMCVRVCVRVSLASDSSETIIVVIITFCTVTSSDMTMHHVLCILTLTFIQGHTVLNHENNKCSFILIALI